MRAAARWRRIPRTIRDVDYLWYNAVKKRNLRTIDGFASVASGIIAGGRTRLREDRLYTLWHAAGQAGEGAVVEIGVYRGGTTAFLAKALQAHGRSNPVYAFDTFEGHAEVDPERDADHRVADGFSDTSYEDVKAFLAPYGATVVRGDIRDTISALGDGPVALAHVDVDVYAATRFCLGHLAERMTPGGIMVVDDYGFVTCPGVAEAVEEFLTTRDDIVRLPLLTAQAVLVKTT